MVSSRQTAANPKQIEIENRLTGSIQSADFVIVILNLAKDS
jgi:hypothetical protein